ncbi:MAG: hypothetical protein MJ202_06485, partial [Lentisphaeria bacterium]|nr:hypothetical protein [Lentisphaeria bacterium]
NMSMSMNMNMSMNTSMSMSMNTSMSMSMNMNTIIMSTVIWRRFAGFFPVANCRIRPVRWL